MTKQTTQIRTLEVDNIKGIEKWTAPDKTEYSRNLKPIGSYCWLYQIRKGRFKARIIRKRTLRAIPPDKADSGFFQEQEVDTLLFQLEQGVKRQNGDWDNIKMTMSPMQGRDLQALFDALDNISQVFSENNKRVEI